MRWLKLLPLALVPALAPGRVGAAAGAPAGEVMPLDQASSAAKETGVPPDAVMEAAGATIGRIEIEAKDIFDPDKPGENARIFRWANAIHPNTRTSTIRNLLLFKTGTPYSRRILDETARLLREQRYLYDAHIEPIRYENNVVDVRVTTRDVWTLKLGIGVGRSGGTNTTHIGIEDSNFAGFGKEVLIQRKTSVDRTVFRYRYRDPGIGRSHVQLLLEYQDNSDGRVQAIDAGVPFYCLDCRWSAQTSLRKGLKETTLWDRGEVTDRFTQEGRGLDIDYGWSRGLVRGRALRFRVGYSFDEERFAPEVGAPPPTVLPENRRLAYPWFGIESADDAYVTTHDMDKLHRTEDINLGRTWYVQLGWMAPAFGADRTGLAALASAHQGLRVGPGQLVFLDGSFEGRFTTAGPQNVIGSGSVRYFKRWEEWAAFSVLLQGTMARALDADRQILIGGDSGLRGYPLRYLSGDRSVLLTVEQRFYGRPEVLHLLRFGGAVFADVGGAWYHDTPEPLENAILRDVGFGLRIGSTRSSAGSMLHLDLAFPLDATGGIKRVQFLVSTHDTF